MVDLVLDPVQADTLAKDLARVYARDNGLPYPIPPQFYGRGKQPVPLSRAYLRYYVRPGQGSGTLHIPGEASGLDLKDFPYAIQKQLNQNARIGPMLGMNCFLTFDDISECVALGVGWIRTDKGIEWSTGWQPTEADFNAQVAAAGASGIWPALQAFKTQVANAHASGIRVLATAYAAPSWARGANRTDGGEPRHQAVLPQYRPHFAEYVRQVMLCQPDALELVNEPNLQSEYWLGPGHPRTAFPDERVDDYVLQLQTVYTRCKADPLISSIPIGIGGTAVAGHEQLPTPGGSIHPTTWYQRLFNSKADDRTTSISAAGYFDFACHHPYADLGNNNGPIDWTHQRIAQPGDAVYQHGVAETWRIRQALVAAGCGDKQLWATELGSATSGRPGDHYITESEQVQWLVDYVTAWTTNGSSGYSAPLATNFYGDFTGPMFIYQLRDLSDGVIEPTNPHGFFGLIRHDGTKKPAYDALIGISTESAISPWYLWRQSKTTLRNVR